MLPCFALLRFALKEGKKWSDWLPVSGEVRQQVHSDSADPLDLAQRLCLAQGLRGSPWQQRGHDPLARLTELHSLIVICGPTRLDSTRPDWTGPWTSYCW